MNKWSFTVFEYGEKWKVYRRVFHEFFNTATAKRYDEDQKRAVSRLLKNLSEHPMDFRHHIQLATGSLALSIMYGIRVDSAENPYFHAAEEAIESLQEALVPGAFAVEFLPIREPLCCNNSLNLSPNLNIWVVLYIPSWLPGGGAHSYGEYVYKRSMDSIQLPMQFAMEQLEVRSVRVCVCE